MGAVGFYHATTHLLSFDRTQERFIVGPEMYQDLGEICTNFTLVVIAKPGNTNIRKMITRHVDTSIILSLTAPSSLQPYFEEQYPLTQRSFRLRLK